MKQQNEDKMQNKKRIKNIKCLIKRIDLPHIQSLIGNPARDGDDVMLIGLRKKKKNQKEEKKEKKEERNGVRRMQEGSSAYSVERICYICKLDVWHD